MPSKHSRSIVVYGACIAMGIVAGCGPSKIPAANLAPGRILKPGSSLTITWMDGSVARIACENESTRNVVLRNQCSGTLRVMHRSSEWHSKTGVYAAGTQSLCGHRVLYEESFVDFVDADEFFEWYQRAPSLRYGVSSDGFMVYYERTPSRMQLDVGVLRVKIAGDPISLEHDVFVGDDRVELISVVCEGIELDS